MYINLVVEMQRTSSGTRLLELPSLDARDMKKAPAFEPGHLLSTLIFLEAYGTFFTKHLVLSVHLKGHVSQRDRVFRQFSWGLCSGGGGGGRRYAVVVSVSSCAVWPTMMTTGDRTRFMTLITAMPPRARRLTRNRCDQYIGGARIGRWWGD